MRRRYRDLIDDERGASLALAVVFMVVIGMLAMATLAMITSGLNNRRNLDTARDREYAAESAIDYAIARVRATPGSGPGLASCAGADETVSYTSLQPPMRVTCENAPTTTFSGLLQRNVVFTACEGGGTVKCPASSAVIRAQVNYETQGGASNVETLKTYIQSWSVNK